MSENMVLFATGKKCCRCEELKAADQFEKDAAMRSGLCSYCRPCRRAMNREWADANREKTWAMMRKRNYGVTQEQYEAMLDAQGSVCAICKEPERQTSRNGRLKNLAVDHCHDTGRVRGLLCANCNNGIGAMRDNPQILVAALEYLTR